MADRLPAMRDCLAMAEAPTVEPGKQCDAPCTCEFKDRCTAGKPDDWIAYLPRLVPSQASAFATLGIEAISAIPAEFSLSWKQAIIRDVTASGKPYISSDLASLLHGFGPPSGQRH